MAPPIVAVVVPWHDSDPHRAAAWAHLQHRWATTHPDWPVLEGRPPPGPWVKALAIADGLARTDANIIVLTDADVWCDGVALAVDAVAAGAAWAIPHHHVHRLTAEATSTVLAGGPFGGGLDRKPYRGFAGGGITVIRRELLERAPLDRRFVGWGQEDQAAALAWQTLAGDPWRGRGDLWHLWHPPQPRWSIQWGSPASHALWRRYRAATGNPARMAALIAEAGQPAMVPARVTPQREEPAVGTTNTWRNKNDGRTTTTRADTQRDRIFRRHGDWLLAEEPAPAPPAASEPTATPPIDEEVVVVGPEETRAGDEPPAEGGSADGAKLRHTGAGWYEVVIDGDQVDRVRGREAAEARAAELEALAAGDVPGP